MKPKFKVNTMVEIINHPEKEYNGLHVTIDFIVSYYGHPLYLLYIGSAAKQDLLLKCRESCIVISKLNKTIEKR